MRSGHSAGALVRSPVELVNLPSGWITKRSNSTVSAVQLNSARPDPPPGPYLVAGMGRAGRAATRRLVSLSGPDAVTAWDASSRDAVRVAARDLERDGVRAVVGGDGRALLDARPGCVVKSPGIAPSVPLLTEARRRRIAVIDELELGWRLDGRPVVAVTGTNGKSTVASLAVALLSAAGGDPVLAGNVHPGPAFTELSHHDGDVVVCEASSFQLEGCPAFLPEVALFTNLTLEHLDRHVTMARYGAAKRRMFVRAGNFVPVAVVNVDDPFGARLAEEVRSRGGTALRYGETPRADYRLVDCSWSVSDGWVCADTPRGRVELSTRLPGPHNALNSLAALALADALDVAAARAATAIGSTAAVPGRFQVIECDQPFDVIVDYAHNPDGLRRTLEAGRALIAARGSSARLRVVCSAPRIRNEHQRQMMGQIAASMADHLILTTERWPETDAAATLPAGFEAGARVRPIGCCDVVLDRSDAIEHALRAARPGDLVMILGRGSLSGVLLDRSGQPRPFDDRDTARRLLAQTSPSPPQPSVRPST